MKRRTTRRVLLAGVLSSVAGMLIWIGQSGPEESAAVPQIGAEEANNSFHDVRFQVRDSAGHLAYEIHAMQLDQFLNSQLIRLYDLEIHWLIDGWERSYARAREGRVRDDLIILEQEVETVLDGPKRDAVLIHSPSLVLDLNTQHLHTEQKVTLARGELKIHGTGFDYDIRTETGRLRTQVQARYDGRSNSSRQRTLSKRLAELILPIAHARSTASAGPIDLSAGHVEWDTQKQTATYTQDVQLTQGDMRLNADQLTVYSDEGKVHILHAQGQGVWTQTLASGKLLSARAGSIRYFLQQRKVVLKQDVHLITDGNEFTGSHVVYLLDEERIETPPGDEDSDQRIRLKIKSLEATP